jgi:hypothetical protein
MPIAGTLDRVSRLIVSGESIMRSSANLCVLFASLVVQANMHSQQPPLPTPPHVLTCGRSFVNESQVALREGGNATLIPVWTWTPERSKGMPAVLVKNFSTIDECKPASGGSELLVTSSHDAVAIVSRETGDTLFSANVKNAHSAVLLPDHLIAVASSDATDGTGDRLNWQRLLDINASLRPPGQYGPAPRANL